MVIVIPVFPKTVLDCITETVESMWIQYPDMSQCFKFHDSIVKQIEEQFAEDLKEIPKGIVSAKLGDAIADKHFGKRK